MLKTLHIENYALIRETDIAFDGGFVAITGETGAGKSILLGALGLLLGQRADTQVLSDKSRKCVVEATFDISTLGMQPLFEQYDADYDDQLILRREILPSAKSRAFANDSPVGLPFLKELASHILDIHSQYQTLTLTESQFQTKLLDTLSTGGDAQSPTPLARYQALYRQYTSLKHQLEQLTAQEAQNNKEYDYNLFLYNELEAAHLSDGEQQDLEEEARLLEHAETIKEALSLVSALCDGEEGIVSRLSALRSSLGHVASYHEEIASLHQRVDSCRIEMQDILQEAASLDDRITYSPERQQAVNDRLDLLYRLQKKHAVSDVSALLEIQANLERQLQAADSLDDRIRDLMEQVDKVYAQMQQAAEALTHSRQQAATLLERLLTGTQSSSPTQPSLLAQLGMPSARITATITPSADFGPLGHDTVRLLFNANQGGTPRPLADVASGGELSRLMLAIKSLVTSRSLLPTILFDEIDSGVSGDISVAVGNIMQHMASHMQVIAITHLPQIAAKAGQHLKVAKSEEEGVTVSRIRPLFGDERITEIAVMLSSNPPTSAALQTAKELMQQ